jgi:hypothetical protein
MQEFEFYTGNFLAFNLIAQKLQVAFENSASQCAFENLSFGNGSLRISDYLLAFCPLV